MKTTSVTRLKNELSAHLKEVIAGETVLITDRRKPVATLQPLSHSAPLGDISGLCARGIVSPPGGRLSVSRFLKCPKAAGPGGLTEAILEEREGR
jgi:antitoxin (DNA-binding transcriptional repressor) of toxin-antitoxin stability system